MNDKVELLFINSKSADSKDQYFLLRSLSNDQEAVQIFSPVCVTYTA